MHGLRCLSARHSAVLNDVAGVLYVLMQRNDNYHFVLGRRHRRPALQV